MAGPLIVGVIPARGGSKGVPLKNLALLGGAPLIAWTLASAIDAKLDRIVVITDNYDIAAEAWADGIESHQEPATLAGDAVPDAAYVGDCLQAKGIPVASVVVMLRPTSPFRRPEDINAVVQRMLADEDVGCSVRSVRRAAASLKFYVSGDRGHLLSLSVDGAANGPRQGLPTLWRPTGYVDAVRAFAVLWYGQMDGDRILPFETPPERDVDLDTTADFAEAERIAAEHGWQPGSVE